MDDPATWTEVVEGIVGAPTAGYAGDATHVWMVGAGGYIYFTQNPTTGYTVQTDGSIDASNLLCIHGANHRVLIAGGEGGVLLYTRNGGATWSLMATSPTLSNVNTVWARTEYQWLVGTDDGRLWYTGDGGETWERIAFPGELTGSIGEIAFTTHPASPFGYMVHTVDGVGRILRSLDCGNSWYLVPEDEGEIPANAGLTSVGVGISPNVVLAGGTGADEEYGGTDGIIIVGA